MPALGTISNANELVAPVQDDTYHTSSAKGPLDEINNMYLGKVASALDVVIQGLEGPAPRTPITHVWFDANDWLIDFFDSDFAGMAKVCDTLLESAQKVDWKHELPKLCALPILGCRSFFMPLN